MSSAYKAVIIVGARQVGKSTMLKHLVKDQNRTYATMDDNTQLRPPVGAAVVFILLLFYLCSGDRYQFVMRPCSYEQTLFLILVWALDVVFDLIVSDLLVFRRNAVRHIFVFARVFVENSVKKDVL